MSENLNIFGKNQEEIGSLDKNLVLRTKGRVYIRYGRKYIDVLDSKGNLNIKVPKVIRKVDSLDDITEDGLYLYNGDLYAYIDGELIQLTGTEGQYISYAIEQNLSQDEINIAQHNIGLTFNSIDDALTVIDNGIVFVGDKIYYINDGEYELISLNEPLTSINQIGYNPDSNNQILVFKDGIWQYTNLNSGGGTDLNVPLSDINETDFEDLEPIIIEGETEEDNVEIPIAIVKQGDEWKYMHVVPYEMFKECCDLVKSMLTKYTVRFFKHEGDVEPIASMEVLAGSIIVFPSVQDDVPHEAPDGWYNEKDGQGIPIPYDVGTVESDMDFYVIWKCVDPIIYIESDKPFAGQSGDKVNLYYWVDWEGDIITQDITFNVPNSPTSDGINFTVVDKGQVTYKNHIAINKEITFGSFSGQEQKNLIFTASYIACQQQQYEGNISIIRYPEGSIELPDFDYMTFKYSWTDGIDLDSATYIRNSGILIVPDNPNTSSNESKYLEDYYVGYGGAYRTERQDELLVMQYIKHAGDNTRSGAEGALVNIKKIIEDLNKEGNKPFDGDILYVDIYANWYQQKPSQNPIMKISFDVYKGGYVEVNTEAHTFIPSQDAEKKGQTIEQSGINVYAFSSANTGKKDCCTKVAEVRYNVRQKTAVLIPYKNGQTGRQVVTNVSMDGSPIYCYQGSINLNNVLTISNSSYSGTFTLSQLSEKIDTYSTSSNITYHPNYTNGQVIHERQPLSGATISLVRNGTNTNVNYTIPQNTTGTARTIYIEIDSENTPAYSGGHTLIYEINQQA